VAWQEVEVKITWSKRAIAHLRSCYDYWLREQSEVGADLMLDRIFTRIEALEQHPEIGRKGRIAGTRQLVLRPLPFLIAYRIRKRSIEIVALLHGSRKWPHYF
jgi:toxin ParE1/3/4